MTSPALIPESVRAVVLYDFGGKVLNHVRRQMLEHLHGDLILDRFHQALGP